MVRYVKRIAAPAYLSSFSSSEGRGKRFSAVLSSMSSSEGRGKRTSAYLICLAQGSSAPDTELQSYRRSRAMVSEWRECVTKDTHFRELSGLAGIKRRNRLPIEDGIPEIRELIRTHSVSAVRSPPGSGNTRILPELLQGWFEQREEPWNKSVMLVFPTQYG